MAKPRQPFRARFPSEQRYIFWLDHCRKGGVMVFLGQLEYRRQWHVGGREFREGKGNGGIMGEDRRCKAAGTSV
jgi:hypothetical protein